MKFSRRTAMEVLGAGALLPVAATPAGPAQVPAPPKESSDTPKIALSMGDSGAGAFGGGRGGRDATGAPADPTAGPRKIKQLGVDNVLGGGGNTPWTEESL